MLSNTRRRGGVAVAPCVTGLSAFVDSFGALRHGLPPSQAWLYLCTGFGLCSILLMVRTSCPEAQASCPPPPPPFGSLSLGECLEKRLVRNGVLLTACPARLGKPPDQSCAGNRFVESISKRSAGD